ncbi:hydroxymethylglutaryl-CoA lyase [Salinibacter sp. 10B]|uniref:hydroxymethylglutaryl-CoA lyase n=1 Tax=Salinibacter sp. 10B TaxID=1923971 RepID=UPI000CF39A64|nr:hydroxymethylglutaryl-CoA lyase [Salinibacter sp. 10B]PQJ36332.1 hydroxymethylglutaryl-CoA lyase [Salinibacter sp. 10B]
MSLPSRVALCDVGPRDGFQFEDQFIPTDLKVATITALADAGVPRIQVTSFVHPEWVPQMRDAESVCERLPPRDDVTYAGLALNQKGLERAHNAGLSQVDLSIATHDQHSLDNANVTVDEAVAQAEEMVRYAHEHGLEAQMGFQTVFGYQEPGDTPLPQVVDMSRHFAEMGVESISLADSTGLAHPHMIQERVEAVLKAIGDVPLVLHLHDTRGLGLANVYAALECGVDRFDTSLAGMGGCPFIEGATGNIATEDTAYLLDGLGIESGIDRAAVSRASRRIEEELDKQFPGKLHRL